MLKRYQVLINDWLGDFIKDISEKYDISFSETIRISLCLLFVDGIIKSNPKYKSKIPRDKIQAFIKKQQNGEKVEPEVLHKFFSDVYFETRKAVEHWEEQEKKRKKKK